MTTFSTPPSSGAADTAFQSSADASSPSLTTSLNPPETWWMVVTHGAGSQRFPDHLKQVEIVEFSETRVRTAGKVFGGVFERKSDKIAFFPTRSEAVKWFREWITNSLAFDQTNLAITEARIKKHTTFLSLLDDAQG